MGGYVARALAAAHPQWIEALVLIATSARGERAAAPLSGSTGRATFAGLSRRAIQRSLGPNHANDEALIERVRAMSIRLGADAFDWQSALDRTDIPLERISCPTLVVAARNDQLRSIDESRELVDAIRRAELRIIEGTGHLIPLEAPRQLAETLLNWLRR
ncbi:pimeloyl-ACP methyl ester carboxylesterase [Lysobacter sp. OAE881]|uniref:alpha/beta fold hydrolase n=1 Tax=Lysobacter sp. OAE881 TaxID=2663813 RepID=UPI003395B163